MKTQTANPASAAKSFYKKHSCEWMYIPMFLVSDIKNYIATLFEKGWSEERINAWMKIYVRGMYGPKKTTTICHVSDGKSDDWKMLYRIAGSVTSTRLITNALERYPNDIDLAYNDYVENKMIALRGRSSEIDESRFDSDTDTISANSII